MLSRVPLALQRLPGHRDACLTCMAMVDEEEGGKGGLSSRLFSGGLDGALVEWDVEQRRAGPAADSLGGAVWQLAPEPRACIKPGGFETAGGAAAAPALKQQRALQPEMLIFCSLHSHHFAYASFGLDTSKPLPFFRIMVQRHLRGSQLPVMMAARASSKPSMAYLASPTLAPCPAWKDAHWQWPGTPRERCWPQPALMAASTCGSWEAGERRSGSQHAMAGRAAARRASGRCSCCLMAQWSGVKLLWYF